MKVSVITVCYNSSKTILDTIKSINQQTYPDIEHIFVDGQSNDSTLEIINENSNRNPIIISESDEGLYYAMNKGVKLATGDIIGILNSDDFFKDNFVLQKIVNQFEITKSDMVYGNIDYLNSENKIVRYWKSSVFKKKSFSKGWHPPHPSLFIKKKIYDKYGVFNTDLRICSDFELMLRFFEVNNISSSYLDLTTTTMLVGGVSNTLAGILRGRKEINIAFKLNNIKRSIFYDYYRYLPKILKLINK